MRCVCFLVVWPSPWQATGGDPTADGAGCGHGYGEEVACDPTVGGAGGGPGHGGEGACDPTCWVAQVVVLGTGKKSLETKVKALEAKFPGVAKGVVKFSTPLAHLINAGAPNIRAHVGSREVYPVHAVVKACSRCLDQTTERPLALHPNMLISRPCHLEPHGLCASLQLHAQQ